MNLPILNHHDPRAVIGQVHVEDGKYIAEFPSPGIDVLVLCADIGGFRVLDCNWSDGTCYATRAEILYLST